MLVVEDSDFHGGRREVWPTSRARVKRCYRETSFRKAITAQVPQFRTSA